MSYVDIENATEEFVKRAREKRYEDPSKQPTKQNKMIYSELREEQKEEQKEEQDTKIIRDFYHSENGSKFLNYIKELK